MIVLRLFRFNYQVNSRVLFGLNKQQTSQLYFEMSNIDGSGIMSGELIAEMIGLKTKLLIRTPITCAKVC